MLTRNPIPYSVNLGQSGLGLPDRDYYLLLNDKQIVAARDGYRAYIAKIFDLAQIPGGAEKADAIPNLENRRLRNCTGPARNGATPTKPINPTTVARRTGAECSRIFPWPRIPRRAGNPRSQWTARGVSSSKRIQPSPDWPRCLQRHRSKPGATISLSIISRTMRPICQKRSMKRASSCLAKPWAVRNLRSWRARSAECCSSMASWVKASANFYVARYFSPEAKAKAQSLVSNLLAIYRQRIQAADWMSPATRQQALEKLARINVKIGYPDMWRDYSRLQVDPNDLLGNGERAGEFEWNRRLARLDQPAWTAASGECRRRRSTPITTPR